MGKATDRAAGLRRPPLPPGPYLIVGIGLAGKAAAHALVSHADPREVRAWDASIERHASDGRRELAALGVATRLGGDGLDTLDGVRTVVKSPGVRPGIPLLRAARARGILVLDELELGWRLAASPVVGVTGTNGKSTTTALLGAVLAAGGRRPVLAGNTRAGVPLSAVESPGGRWIVAEVSSYQLGGSPCFLPDAAVLTNVTREHVQWHGSMAAYAAAKRRLFVRGDRAVPLAALNADDPLGVSIAGEVAARGGAVLTYGTGAGCDYRVASVTTLSAVAATVVVQTPTGAETLQTRLPGAHNAMNVTAALALADGLGIAREATIPALEQADPVPGRFEPVDAGQPFDVVVDFAHSPDGVEKALATARDLARRRDGRVIAVLGVVSRSDRLTRELTGRGARRMSDVLVLCASSMRGEPGLVGLAGLLAGARSAPGGELDCVIDRGRAIALAIGRAEPGDVVVTMGRGPLNRMSTDARGGFRPFDDRDVARRVIEASRPGVSAGGAC